jgi:hypothetical protein
LEWVFPEDVEEEPKTLFTIIEPEEEKKGEGLENPSSDRDIVARANHLFEQYEEHIGKWNT